MFAFTVMLMIVVGLFLAVGAPVLVALLPILIIVGVLMLVFSLLAGAIGLVFKTIGLALQGVFALFGGVMAMVGGVIGFVIAAALVVAGVAIFGAVLLPIALPLVLLWLCVRLVRRKPQVHAAAPVPPQISPA